MEDNVYISIGDNFSYPDRIFTEISIHMGEYAFPYENWQDFSYSVLSSCTFALMESTYTPRSVELCFYDGPHLLKAVIHDSQNVILTGISHDKTVCTAEVMLHELLLAIRAALRQLQQILSDDPGELTSVTWNSDIEHNIKKINDYLKNQK
ncbi:MAG: hypothetical protein J6L96_01675 [Clostridia bacterium]|nr:hypothetical protein [Clostridia bacterium]